MKPGYFLLLVPLLLSGCEKNVPNSNDDTDIPGLPPITQTGANTLGFLLNGEPWTPAGPNNLSIDFDQGINNGIVGIVAYKRTTQAQEQFIVGFRDSLNFIKAPSFHALTAHSIISISLKKDLCDYWNYLPEVKGYGSFHLMKLDHTQRIMAGTFEATLYRNGCDTIHITKGRFDMGF